MKFLTSLILLLFSLTLFAQNNPNNNSHPNNSGSQNIPKGTISGTVVETKTGTPVEFANVIVFKAKDSTQVTGGLTNPKGKFYIENVPAGRYFLKVNFIGFAIKRINDVFVKPPDQLNFSTGTIELTPTATNLNSVEVVAEKNQIDYNLDKKVINVDKNILSAGGTALDVMQTIPSIQVDIDGTVSLRGSSNVTIFVDGKPSGLTSLDQMPANMIDKVEIVTNPSARYDPDGMSGIINIVTKRKKEPGYYGMISANYSTMEKYGASLNLGYNRRKFNIYGNFDFKRNVFPSTSSTSRELYNNDTTTYFNIFNNSKRQGYFYNTKIGADWFINKKNTLSVYGVYNNRNGKSSETSKYRNYGYNHVFDNFYNRENMADNFNQGVDASLDYRRTYERPGRELTANIFYSTSKGNSTSDLTTTYLDEAEVPFADSLQKQETENNNNNNSLSWQVDYVHPFKTKGRFETGYKGNYRSNINDYKLFDQANSVMALDTLSSNKFNYIEQIHAAYFIYGNNINKFKYQAGLRFEQAFITSNQMTSRQKYHNDYFGIFPTVHLKYEFTEHNAIQLSYSRRVNRPRSSQLNPFVNYTDPMNISSGNPLLKPEFTNSFELAHLFDVKKTSLITTLFYRDTRNMITQVLDIDSTGVSNTTYRNMNNGATFGIELVLSQGLWKWWKVNGNLSYYGVYFNDHQSDVDDKIKTSWNAKINSSMTFFKSWDVQLSFNYRSKTITAQSSGDYRGSGSGSGAGSRGTQAANYFFDLGMKKDFFKNKLSMSLRLSDIFNTNKYDLVTTGGNYQSTSHRKRETRVLYFSISYKINGGIKSKKKKMDDNQFDYEE
jgi:outer membrane receptor protein involved in Fe transport